MVSSRSSTAVFARRATQGVVHFLIGAVVSFFARFAFILTLFELECTRLAQRRCTSSFCGYGACSRSNLGKLTLQSHILFGMRRLCATPVSIVTWTTHRCTWQLVYQVYQVSHNVCSVCVRATVTVHTTLALDAVTVSHLGGTGLVETWPAGQRVFGCDRAVATSLAHISNVTNMQGLGHWRHGLVHAVEAWIALAIRGN